MSKYRLYIDESGEIGYSSKPKEEQTFKQRYLSLTGIIIENEDNENILQPQIRSIRKLFTDDPDALPVLHRDEICKGMGGFSKLQDSAFQRIYNNQFENLIKTLPFEIITIVIDKANHKDKYGDSSMNPYHYSLNLILERYVKFLENTSSRGDVMVEARGKKEDKMLQEVYERFYCHGTYYMNSSRVQSHLTSKKVKMKNKELGIGGLQLADLVSLPSKLDVLKSYGIISSLKENYTLEVIKLIQKRYFVGGFGIIGAGKKLI